MFRRLLHLYLLFTVCTVLSACGLSSEQRLATITFGHSLSDYGQLLTQESTYIRSEVKLLRVLAMSLPDQQSLDIFGQANYQNLALEVEEPKIQYLVQLGGAAQKFGTSLADVASITSTTANEKAFSRATHELAQIAGVIGAAASGVSLGAPAVDIVTFVSTQAYRRNYLKRALPAAQPVFHAAVSQIDRDFSPDNTQSLLSVMSTANDQLAAILQASNRSLKPVTAEDRYLITNGYRLVARNRDHIRYVTRRQQELVRKGELAFDALTSSIEGNESHLLDVESFSSAVFQVRIAFKSLD